MTSSKSYSGEDLFHALEEHLQGKQPELEYKIKVDRKMFAELLGLFSDMKPILSQTSNAIYNIDLTVSGIKQMYNYIISKDYGSSEITKYTKQRLVDGFLDDFPNIRLSVSLETPLKDKPSGVAAKASMFRIKNRLSFECGDWRYDFTQVAQIDPNDPMFNQDTVKMRSINLFANSSTLSGPALVKQFIVTSSDPSIRQFELEIELIDKFKLEHINSHSFLHCLKSSNQLSFRNKIYYDLMLKSLVVALGSTISKGLSIKRILPSATTLSKVDYNYIYPPVGYYISRKADGERALLITTSNGISYLLTDKLQQLDGFDIIHVSGIFVPEVILEGEFITGKINHFLAYDALMDNNKLVTEKDYSERITLVPTCCNYYKELSSIKVLPKKVYRITENLHDVFKQVSTDAFPFPDDGFVMTESHNDYFNTKCYKIKEQNTIDFLVVKLPPKFAMQLGDRVITDANASKRGSDIYLLFCGINTNVMDNMGISKLPFHDALFRGCRFRERIPIHFAPPDDPYAFIWYASKEEDKILSEYIEKADPNRPWVIAELDLVLTKNDGKREWKLVRIREDRFNEPNYFGNDYVSTALPNWIIIHDPLKISDMHLNVVNYFKTGKEDFYHAQTSTMSYIKYFLFNMVFSEIDNKSPSVIDLAVGKGQDLNKYISNNVSRLLGIDIDKVALNELLTRYYNLVSKGNGKVRLNVNIMQQDLCAPNIEITEKIKSLWLTNKEFVYPNLIICNLAIHYFIKSIDELTNVATLLKSLLPSGGIFMYTTFNGKVIHKMLTDSPNGEWLCQEAGAVKYRIVKKYQGNQLTEFGQTIQVKLPFTGEELYTENLVNIDFVNEVFSNLGLKVIKSGSYSDFFPLLKSEHKLVESNLTDDDRTFISLYSYTIMKMA